MPSQVVEVHAELGHLLVVLLLVGVVLVVYLLGMVQIIIVPATSSRHILLLDEHGDATVCLEA